MRVSHRLGSSLEDPVALKEASPKIAYTCNENRLYTMACASSWTAHYPNITTHGPEH